MGLYHSGRQTTSKSLIKEKCFYRGSILLGQGEVATLSIHNCREIGDATDDNTVGELSVPAIDGAYAIDPVFGSIGCPLGMCSVLDGSAKYHVRGSALP